MKRFLFLMASLFLIVNSQAVAMDGCCCVCDDDTAGVRQKIVWDLDEQAHTYQYSQPSNRWRLVKKNRPNPNKPSDFIFTYYLTRNSQIEVYETENGTGRLVLVETLTIEQYNELDLKREGQFVVGLNE